MRSSSLMDSPELHYFCCKCRAENVMDLPHWHWGQVCFLCANTSLGTYILETYLGNSLMIFIAAVSVEI